MAERIVGKKIGNENCYRVKINKEDKGKTRNTGKSKKEQMSNWLSKTHLRELFKEELDKVVNDEVIEKIEEDIWCELMKK